MLVDSFPLPMPPRWTTVKPTKLAVSNQPVLCIYQNTLATALRAEDESAVSAELDDVKIVFGLVGLIDSRMTFLC